MLKVLTSNKMDREAKKGKGRKRKETETGSGFVMLF
jgi:hypothetical protein